MPDNHPEKSILVLGASAKASIPILESCAAMGLHVIAGSEKKYCCGFFSRATHQRLIYPCPHSQPRKCIDFLINFLRSTPVAAMFPTGDVMTDLIARNQDAFRKHTAFTLPAYEVFRQGRDKILTLQAAARAGCPIPMTWYPSKQPLHVIAKEAVYPLLIKPAVSAGSRGIIYCASAQDLVTQFTETEKKFGECFVQEFIPQTGRQYKADLIVNSTHELLAGVAYAKLRYYPPTGGSSVLNKTEHRDDIIELAHKVVKELKWVGFCDFDFITDPRDGTVKLMEINPRYPESFRATVAAGVDMTKIMYQLASGKKPIPQLSYLSDRYLRFLFGDIMWFLTTKDNRWKTDPPFFSFFRRDTLYQLLRLGDWGIILGYILENLSILWDKEYRDLRLRRDRLQ